jgi:uncharacterized protein
MAHAQVPDHPGGYITDAASVFSSAELKALETRCASLDQNRRGQIAVVTVASLQGEPIDKLALNLFRRWGIGRKGVNDGLLIMIAIREQQSRITVGYGLEKNIPDSVAQEVLLKMRRHLRDRRFALALNIALDSIEERLSGRP